MSRSHHLTLAALAFAALSLAPLSAQAQLSFTYETFQPPAADPTIGSGAFGISASGAVSGLYFDSQSVSHAYVRSNAGGFTTIDDPQATNTEVLSGGINNAGYVTGNSFNYDENGDYKYVRNFIYNINTGAFISPHAQIDGVDAGTTALQNVNEAGIVGVQYSPVPGDAPGPLHSASYDINTDKFTYYDDIAGYKNALQAVGPNGELLINLTPDGAPNKLHGSLTRNGVTTLLDFPGATRTAANAITKTGLVSGNYLDASGHRYGFIYDSNIGKYYQLEYPGAAETFLYHGNNDSQFAGYWTGTDGVYHSLIVTAVPEPGTVALFVGTGVAGAGLLRRRKTRAR